MAMNRQTTKVSVIIPTFNRSELIGRAIKSVLAQTRQPNEIILVDDGSTDETRTLIHQNFPMVKYFRQRNNGVSSARNAGIRMANGDWIAFLDSDDEWLPKKLAEQMNALSTQPNLKVCYTNEVWYRTGKRVNQKKKHGKVGGYIYQNCLPLCIISPSAVIIHRDIFDEVGLFDEALPACEDYDLWLRLCSRFPVLYLPEPLIAKYGGHDDQLSKRFWGMDRFRIQALEKILDSDHLTDSDRRETIKMLLTKTRIVRQGAAKRRKIEIVKKLRSIEKRYRENIEMSV